MGAGPLIEVSNYLARLKFETTPDYNFLQGCLDRLTDASPVHDPSVPPQSTAPAEGTAVPLMPAGDVYPQASFGAVSSLGMRGSHENLNSLAANAVPSFAAPALNGQHQAPAENSQRQSSAYLQADWMIADTPRSPVEENEHAQLADGQGAAAVTMLLPAPGPLPAPITLPAPERLVSRGRREAAYRHHSSLGGGSI